MFGFVWGSPRRSCLWESPQGLAVFERHLAYRTRSSKRSLHSFLWPSQQPTLVGDLDKLLPLWAQEGEFGLRLLPCTLSPSTTGLLLYKVCFPTNKLVSYTKTRNEVAGYVNVEYEREQQVNKFKIPWTSPPKTLGVHRLIRDHYSCWFPTQLR